MAEITKEELQNIISSVVAKEMASRELATKGATQDGDKIVFTQEAFKERLERAKRKAVEEFLQEVGVESTDALKQQLELAQQASSTETNTTTTPANETSVDEALSKAGVSKEQLPLLKDAYKAWQLENEGKGIDEFVEAAKERYNIKLEAANTPGNVEVPETVQKPTDNVIDIRDPKVPIEVVKELARQLDS